VALAGRKTRLIAGGLAIGAAAAAAVLLATSAFDGSSRSSSIYWGAWISGEVFAREGEDPPPDAPWSEPTWNRFAADAGKEPSIVHFGQPGPWLHPFDAEPFERIAARGAIPFLDIDPDGIALRQIADGSEDSAVERWAAAARAYGRPFFFRWAWEMNGSWFQWGREAAADPGLYVAAWRHLHDVVASAGATNVTWVWCPYVTSAATTPLASLYPGDADVDWTCMDGYNRQNGGNAAAAGSTSFSRIFDGTYRELQALAPGKPMMIGETAYSEVDTPPTKPEWIAEALEEELPDRFPRVKALVWFNWNIPSDPGARLDWPIESSPASQAAFAKGIASDYYLPGDPDRRLTPLAPVPAP
jgi:Glycosyl hydrolase family 26